MNIFLLKNIKNWIYRKILHRSKKFSTAFLRKMFYPKKVVQKYKEQIYKLWTWKIFFGEKKELFFCRKFCENFSGKTFEWDIINSFNRNVRIFAIKWLCASGDLWFCRAKTGVRGQFCGPIFWVFSRIIIHYHWTVRQEGKYNLTKSGSGPFHYSSSLPASSASSAAAESGSRNLTKSSRVRPPL